MTVAVVVSGGAYQLNSAQIAAIRAADLVVGADSGLDRCGDASVSVDVVVGDGDSMRRREPDNPLADRTRFVELEIDKDATDLVAAMEYAGDHADRVVLVGTAGGELDHAWGVLGALLTGVKVRCNEALLDDWRVVSVTERWTDDLPEGHRLSILPVAKSELTIVGCRWTLTRELEPAWSSRCLRNLVISNPEVIVHSGHVIVLHPQSQGQPQ